MQQYFKKILQGQVEFVTGMQQWNDGEFIFAVVHINRVNEGKNMVTTIHRGKNSQKFSTQS